VTEAGRDRGALRLFRTPEHPCSYLPGRAARTLFPDPDGPMDHGLYGALIELGFRRSGAYVYRPDCEGCDACVPLRLPVARFRPRRRHRRTLQRNRDLRVTGSRARFSEEHFALFRRYIDVRHADGDMSDTSEAQYRRFLLSDWCETLLFEFRAGKRLVAVAVTDRLQDALSAFYTFFDPADAWRSPGTLGILWQVGEAERRGLSRLYLGYWIAECRKMAYKAEFRPLEAFVRGRWVGVEPGEPMVRAPAAGGGL
jgi:arginine-tRNA-protein transferase